MTQRHAPSRLAREVALYLAATVACMIPSTALAAWSLGMEHWWWLRVAVPALTVTWGSWIALTWTRNRGLSSLQRSLIIVPGIGATVYGLMELVFGRPSYAAIAFGLLTVVWSAWMPRDADPRHEPTSSQLMVGLLIYPLVVALAAHPLVVDFIDPARSDSTLAAIRYSLIAALIPGFVSFTLRPRTQPLT